MPLIWMICTSGFWCIVYVPPVTQAQYADTHAHLRCLAAQPKYTAPSAPAASAPVEEEPSEEPEEEEVRW